jgi:hypothetical protein
MIATPLFDDGFGFSCSEIDAISQLSCQQMKLRSIPSMDALTVRSSASRLVAALRGGEETAVLGAASPLELISRACLTRPEHPTL